MTSEEPRDDVQTRRSTAQPQQQQHLASSASAKTLMMTFFVLRTQQFGADQRVLLAAPANEIY